MESLKLGCFQFLEGRRRGLFYARYATFLGNPPEGSSTGPSRCLSVSVWALWPPFQGDVSWLVSIFVKNQMYYKGEKLNLIVVFWNKRKDELGVFVNKIEKIFKDNEKSAKVSESDFLKLFYSGYFKKSLVPFFTTNVRFLSLAIYNEFGEIKILENTIQGTWLESYPKHAIDATTPSPYIENCAFPSSAALRGRLGKVFYEINIRFEKKKLDLRFR